MVGASLRGTPASYKKIERKRGFITRSADATGGSRLCRRPPSAEYSLGSMYLEFLEGEATASSNAAVVPEGWASHNGTELVHGTGSNSGRLSETSLTTTVLPAGL